MTELGQITAGRADEIFCLTADLYSFVRLLLKPADKCHKHALSLAKKVGTRFEAIFTINEMKPSVHRLMDIAVLVSDTKDMTYLCDS